MSDRSALLNAVPHIQHGFGSKLALLPGHLLPYSATLPEKKQVHGTRIVDDAATGAGVRRGRWFLYPPARHSAQRTDGGLSAGAVQPP